MNPKKKEVAKSYFGIGDADTIEFILYDSSDNLLPQGENGDLVRYIFLDDVNIYIQLNTLPKWNLDLRLTNDQKIANWAINS